MKLFSGWDYTFCNDEDCQYKHRCKRYIGNYPKESRPEYLSFKSNSDGWLSCGYFIDGNKGE